jgi:hypothetical protein
MPGAMGQPPTSRIYYIDKQTPKGRSNNVPSPRLHSPSEGEIKANSWIPAPAAITKPPKSPPGDYIYYISQPARKRRLTQCSTSR